MRLSAIEADGIGFFPVVVIVTNEARLPIRGVTVQLEDSGKLDSASVNDPADKLWMERIGHPADTDASGVAVLLYYGRWSSSGTSRKRIYGRQVRGKVVIDIPGYDRVERAVADTVGGARTSTSPTWAPVIQITMTRKAAAK